MAPAAELDPRFSRPDCLFYVIGAQKSGTSWLHDYFLGHPDIHVTAWKEADYWNTVRPPFDVNTRLEGALAEQDRLSPLARLFLPPLIRRRHANQRRVAAIARGADTGVHDGYADLLFDHYRGQTAVGEVNPQYARLGPETFAEMARMAETVRFVFVMRDPLSRILSRLRQTVVRSGGDPVAVLEQALAEGEASDLIARSRYDRVIAALEGAVPEVNLAYFFYETLFEQAELDRLTAFLGARPRKGWTGRKVFASKGAPFDLPKTLEAALLDRLSPTYDMVRARFGDAVPAKWREVADA